MGKPLIYLIIIYLFIFSTIAISNVIDFNSYDLEGESNSNIHFSSQQSSTIQYTERDPILIDGDNDFHSQAMIEEWDLRGIRDGSSSLPYIISGYKIVNSTSNLIDIRNTNIHFQITQCLLDGIIQSPIGIYFDSVENGVIKNNFVYSSFIGIALFSSVHSKILNNTIYNSDNCIKLIDSKENTITGNLIHDIEGNGIWLEGSDNNIIEWNTIYNSGSTNPGNGIFLSSSTSNNLISHNEIYNSSFSGIQLIDSAYNNRFNSNSLYNNSRFGIWVDNLACNNKFFNNTIVNNSDYGIAFDSATSNNYVVQNIFINNNQEGISQAWDAGFENSFERNYWDEWTDPDFNLDDIVDIPYSIDGSSGSQDQYPLVLLLNTPGTIYNNLVFDHNESFTIKKGQLTTVNQCIVPKGNIISFYGDGTLKVSNSNFYYLQIFGNLRVIITSSTIAYTEIKDYSQSKYQNVTLQQFFASHNTTNIFVHCNITKLFDGSPIPGAGHSGTMIKAGFYSRIILMEPDPWVSRWGASPAGIIWLIRDQQYGQNETISILSGLVEMEFYVEGFNPRPIGNSENISIRFYVDDILELSTDILSNDSNWNWGVSYNFNSSKYSNGLHKLSVYINDSSAENWIFLPIMIHNVEHTLSLPTIIYPTGGESLSGIVTVQWTAAVDSHNHQINYFLDYFLNEGNNWIPLFSGSTTKTTYQWDTTKFPNGDKYRIKVKSVCSEGWMTVDESKAFSIKNLEITTVITTTWDTSTLSSTTSTRTSINITSGGSISILLIAVIGIIAIRRVLYLKK